MNQKTRMIREYLNSVGGSMSEMDIMDDACVTREDIERAVDEDEIRVVAPQCGGAGRWYDVVRLDD